MPIVLSKKQRIHYRLEGDRGAFLVLYSPFLETIEGWYRQGYVEQLKDHYQLILVDPIGHGRSDISLEAEHYTMDSRAENLLDIMAELEVRQFHFLGMGLGGQVGFFLAAHFPERLRSFVTAGVHPYAITTDYQTVQQWLRMLRRDGLEAFLEAMKAEGHIGEEQAAALKEGSPDAYALLLEAICQWQGLGDQLETMVAPGLLLTATTEDKFLSIREAARKMPRARYHILPELRYEGTLLAAELVVPQLIEFIRKQRRFD